MSRHCMSACNHFMKPNLVKSLSSSSPRFSLPHLHQFSFHTSSKKDLTTVTSTHSNFIKSGLSNDTFTTNNLINSYLKLLRISHAQKLFDEMTHRNVVSWSLLMAGYVSQGQPNMALCLFHQMQMQTQGTLVMPNEFTFSTLINACSILASLEIGRRIHALVEVSGYRSDLVVCSSLIDMYGKCNCVDEARMVFDFMCVRNVVSWTSMITTYSQNAQGHLALELFREFNHFRLGKPNHFMLCSAVSACASLGRLGSGKIIHGVVIRLGHDANDVVASALVDMYAKCGCVSYSEKVFRRIPNPSVVHYTSMIVGAAKYGLGTLSLRLFQEMIDRRIKPNDITFVGVLHACSHSGLIDKGLELFNSMNEKHGMMPDPRHYTCTVDMLGRVGRIDEAYQLAKSVQVGSEDDALLWGTLLSASRLHGRVDIALEASNQVIKSNQQVAAAYVTLSNTYALAGDWENAHNLRSKMKRTGVFKEPGSSWIEIKESTYLFHAGDISKCSQKREMLNLLRELEGRMKERGHVGVTTGLVFVDIEEEAREEIVSLHSEKLALAFGLLNTPKGITIRIMKNLRMCRDCHEAFKLISDIVQREFIVRDVNRFHHFKNGLCTCGDFW
ncbi:unnamed protein product [Vicia faba]|uniref:DYW domain-containing protein n=1 Tax=Vicia faba TaxID=3906 RepID=A0AAV1ALQ5_VICFA|nr:unnamed protein product [Vicia faba]